jgi:hypothetical protein
MIKMSDNMIIHNKRSNHGFNLFNTFSSKRDLRSLDHDFSAGHVVRSRLLHPLGGGLDKSSDLCYIRNIQLSRSQKQGEK